MNTIADAFTVAAARPTTALECDFPFVQVSELGEQESWRKEINRPIYHIHKWWRRASAPCSGRSPSGH
jgi:putative DNA methylase